MAGHYTPCTLVLTLLLLLPPPGAEADRCSMTSPCVFDCGDQVMNMASLRAYRFRGVPDSQKREYFSYSPCSTFTEGLGCLNTHVCLENKTDLFPTTNVGGKFSWSLSPQGGDNIFTYKHNTLLQEHRETKVTLQCAPPSTADVPTLKIAGQDPGVPHRYEMTLISRHACFQNKFTTTTTTTTHVTPHTPNVTTAHTTHITSPKHNLTTEVTTEVTSHKTTPKHNITTPLTTPKHNTTTPLTTPKHNITTPLTTPKHNITTPLTTPKHNTTTPLTTPKHNITTPLTTPKHNITTPLTTPKHNITTPLTTPKHNITTPLTTPKHNITTPLTTPITTGNATTQNSTTPLTTPTTANLTTIHVTTPSKNLTTTAHVITTGANVTSHGPSHPTTPAHLTTTPDSGASELVTSPRKTMVALLIAMMTMLTSV